VTIVCSNVFALPLENTGCVLCHKVRHHNLSNIFFKFLEQVFLEFFSIENSRRKDMGGVSNKMHHVTIILG